MMVTRVVRTIGEFFLCIILLAGCVTAQTFEGIDEGMSRTEVVRILGSPDRSRAADRGYEALTYSNRVVMGDRWWRSDIIIILKDGHVVSRGMFLIQPDTQYLSH